MEPTLQPVKKSSRKISLNKGAKKSTRKAKSKAPEKTEVKAKSKTVKKKTAKGEIEVPVVEYNANLSYQFDSHMREAESFKAFKKDLNTENKEYVPAYKEHARRQRKLVKDGKTALDYVEEGAIVVCCLIAAGLGVDWTVDKVRERRARRALEVE